MLSIRKALIAWVAIVWAIGFVRPIFSADQEPAFRDNFYDVAMRGDRAWIVGYYGTILRSDDGGLRWELQSSGTTEALFRVIFVDENRGWACGSYGTILHTRDGGKNWLKQNAPTEEHLFGLWFIDKRRGWAVGSRGSVFSTEDAGATWVNHSIGEDVILNDVRFLDARRGWIVGEFGRIYHSRDGGLRWRSQKSPIEVSFASGESRNLFRLLFPNAHTRWAFGLDGVILSSSNGEQWEVASADGASRPAARRRHLFAASAFDGKTWAVGERGTVLVSAVGNNHWGPAGLKAPPVSLNGIAFAMNGVGLIVGNRGVILRSADGGGSWKRISLPVEPSAKGVDPKR